MNITVYCGAAEGNDPEYIARARELGAWMAEKGHRLICEAIATQLALKPQAAEATA